MKNGLYWFAVVVLAGLFFILVCGGCAYYRDGVTVVTLFKDIDATADPNRVDYRSRSQELTVVTPAAAAGTKAAPSNGDGELSD